MMEGQDVLQRSTIHVLTWKQSGGDICHKRIGLREAQNGVNNGGSRDKVLIKSLQFCVRGLTGCVRALKAHGLRLLTLHMKISFLCANGM